MSWRHIEIAGKPAELFEPPQARYGIVFLHNAKCQSLSISESYTTLLDTHRLACICPFGGASWWTDRILPSYDPHVSAERHVIDAALPFAQEHWQLGPRSIGLLGISMGGQGALRIAFKHPDVFPVVAAVAPAIEYHEYYGYGTPIDAMYSSKEQCRQDTVPMHLNPNQAPPHIFFCVDPDDAHWIRGGERLREKASAIGVLCESDLETRADGHSWDYFNAMAPRAIEFIVHGLDQSPAGCYNSRSD